MTPESEQRLRKYFDAYPHTYGYRLLRVIDRERAALARSEQRAGEAEATINSMVNRLRLAEKVCHAVGSYAMANTQTVPFVEPRMLDAHAEWRAYVHRDPSEATPPRAGEEEPPATEDTLLMIRDEANLAGLFLANDDGDLAAQHVGNIVRIVGDALGGVPATTTTNAGLREALAALWAWVEPKVDWACLRYQPHPDPKKATHYAYDPKNKAVWDLRAQVEAALAAAPPARRVDGGGAK